MSQRPVADQHILLVDDLESVRHQVKRYLDNVDKQICKDNGIGRIDIDLADSVTQAKSFLKDAVTRPFDLVILDLRLPIRSGATNPLVANGFRLLRHIQASQTANGVVVISNYSDYKNLRTAFKDGAVDFVNKPFRQHHVEPTVLKSLVRLMTQQCERLLSQRVFNLVAHSQLGLAHGFRQVFFTLLRGVSEAAEGVERYARERYGLDREKDSDDSLTVLLKAHQDSIKVAREDWTRMQDELAASSSDFGAGNVSEMLRSIAVDLKPALVVKRLALATKANYDRPVHTFENDVGVVLREIIAGALSELSSDGEVRSMSIHFVTEPTRAGVVFEDDLDPIPEKQMRAINEGQRIIPDAKFGRAWGLSVAQHIALRGGGELKVSTKRGKNVITYYIPLAEHA